METPVPTTSALLADPFLALTADVLDDTEAVRIADENRLRQLTRTGADKDGQERGFGLDLTHPAVASLAAMVRAMKCDSQILADLTGEKPGKKKGCCLEHDAERNLARMLRSSPLHPWLAAQKGIGKKQGARLLAAVGDPYIRPEMVRKNADGEVVSVESSRPRMVSELWSYCGMSVVKVPVSGHAPTVAQTMNAAGGSAFPDGHEVSVTQRDLARGEGGDPGHSTPGTQTGYAGVAPRRQRGQRSNWDARARMRVYLVAESCIKQSGTPYRDIYDKTREHYADAVHDAECYRCGPAGSPAKPGTPLSAGHQHARALRKVAKEILRCLWLEAKRIHENT